MKCLGVCAEGFEKAASAEIHEITGKECTEEKAAVKFEADSYKEIAEVTYRTQTLQKVMLVLGEFSFDDITSKLKEEVDRADFGDWLKGTFRVNVYHNEELEMRGMDLAAEAGEYIIDKTNAKARMENPDVIVLVYVINDKCYFGIDFAGINLSKRDYKIYNAPSSLNSATAAGLLKKAGWSPGKVLLDPMCGSGIIPIEAALAYANKPPHFHLKEKLAFTKFMDFDFEKIDKNMYENDKKLGKEANIHCADYVLAALRATKNNAKIADVDRIMNPTKIDLEWLETKYDEKSIDYIVTHPPSPSRHSNTKELKKLYDEFFYQAEYILKDDGVVAVLADSSELFGEAAEKNNFSLDSTEYVWQGQHRFVLMLFRRSS